MDGSGAAAAMPLRPRASAVASPAQPRTLEIVDVLDMLRTLPLQRMHPATSAAGWRHGLTAGLQVLVLLEPHEQRRGRAAGGQPGDAERPVRVPVRDAVRGQPLDVAAERIARPDIRERDGSRASVVE